MFIGEAPGADEDREWASPSSVGRAGQLLTRIIAAMGFTSDDVYIANVPQMPSRHASWRAWQSAGPRPRRDGDGSSGSDRTNGIDPADEASSAGADAVSDRRGFVNRWEDCAAAGMPAAKTPF